MANTPRIEIESHLLDLRGPMTRWIRVSDSSALGPGNGRALPFVILLRNAFGHMVSCLFVDVLFEAIVRRVYEGMCENSIWDTRAVEIEDYNDHICEFLRCLPPPMWLEFAQGLRGVPMRKNLLDSHLKPLARYYRDAEVAGKGPYVEHHKYTIMPAIPAGPPMLPGELPIPADCVAILMGKLFSNRFILFDTYNSLIF